VHITEVLEIFIQTFIYKEDKTFLVLRITI